MAEKTEDNLEEMTFWDHVDALRGVLIKVAVTLVVLAVVLFMFMPSIFDNVILAPCKNEFVLYRIFERLSKILPVFPSFSVGDFSVELINIQLASQFFIHMSTSFWLALVLGFPIVLYELWTFVSPALYPNEKHGVKIAFGVGNIMFYIGIAVGYFIVFPVTLRFLAGYHVSEMVPNQISLDSYMDTFLMLIFVMGVVFELPLVSWLLSNLGILHRGFFKTYRRHAIVFLLVVAAFITPTGDPFTLMIVFLPIYMLYELSALIVKPDPPKDDDEEEDE